MSDEQYATPGGFKPGELEKFKRHQEAMDKGLCPNDDAELTVDADGDKTCPVCGFVLITVPLYIGKRGDA